MDNYEIWFERILSQLREGLVAPENEAMEDWSQRLKHVTHRIAEATYYEGMPFWPSRRLDAHLRQLEYQYEKLENKVEEAKSSILKELNAGFDRPAIACRMRDEDVSGGIAQLIVSGGPSVQAVERGRTDADGFLSKWLGDADEVTILDPFLFKRERPRHVEVETEAACQAADQLYADELLAVVGKDRRVNFIYRGNPDKGEGGPQKVTQGVANRIADRLGELQLRATFFVVEDLHDRVWMKLDKKGRWHAHAVGTSRGGIGRRPTYILPMESDDCSEYLRFVRALMDHAQVSHERPIDFKKPRAKKVSNSGRTRRVGVQRADQSS